MNESDFASTLTELSRSYAEQRLAFDEYRARRRAVLDEMESVFNGRKPPAEPEEAQPGRPDEEITVVPPEQDAAGGGESGGAEMKPPEVTGAEATEPLAESRLDDEKSDEA
jgi:uncharacterized coiled-coil protein SlyX